MEIVQDVIIESQSLDEREYHFDSAHDPGRMNKRSKEKNTDGGEKSFRKNLWAASSSEFTQVLEFLPHTVHYQAMSTSVDRSSV